jgi:hypothetical protein
LLFTLRFALPRLFSASASAAFALRFTVAVADRAFFSTAARAFPAPRLASEAAPSTDFTSEAPISCALSLAAPMASPILVIKLFSLRIFDSPVR